ncbi:hypothetical protein LK994_02055 [Ferruginibacter lapsinanis]|uniref:beta strand repeat-containing protein n=1 Tax=Ferruginibacter lapsinanis TaxID=563172 RepID=UPI001E402147|nr:MBG domain-containing protein [Ferruginibacter lapsinanis]UEG50258.1 hypothetical protein LK994_02055 [Ferruginibacter lapsinanis]
MKKFALIEIASTCLTNCYQEIFLHKFYKVAFKLLFLICATATLHGQTIKTRVTGAANWNTAATWVKALTGTVTAATNSKNITGSGTSFTTQVTIGDVLALDAGGLLGTVATITDNTHLILVANSITAATTLAYGVETVPTASDDVQIGNAALAAVTVTLNVSSATVNSVMWVRDNTANTLTLSGTNALNVTNDVTLTAPSAGATIVWNINGGTATIGGNVLLASSSTGNQSNRVAKIVITTGLLDITGDLRYSLSVAGTTAASAIVDMSGGAGTMKIGGNITFPSLSIGTLTPGTTSIVNFDGSSAITIPIGVSSVIYNDLKINNTNATTGVTLGAAVSATNVTRDIYVGDENSGSLLTTNNLAIARGASDAITVSVGSTMNAGTTSIVWGGASGAITINGIFKTANTAGFSGAAGTAISSTNSPGITLGTNSTVEYTSASPQAITARTDYAFLTTSGAGTKTLGNITTVNKDLTTSGGGLADGGFTLTVKGAISNNVAHTGSGKMYLNGGSASHTLSGAGSFTNLELNDVNGATLTSSLTVNGILTIRAGSTLALASFNLGSPTSLVMESGAISGASITGSGTLTLGGNVTINDIATGTTGASIASFLALGGSDRTFTIADNAGTTNDLIISGPISGLGGIIKSGSGSSMMFSASNNNYTGTTTINAGEIRLNPSANATFASQIILNGGKLSTVNITSGRTFTSSSTLKLDASSTIDLGNNVHSVTFSNSSAVTWAGTTLAITGWIGTGGSSGTGGRVFVGSGGLLSTQLNKVNFSGYAPGAVIVSGEVVPTPPPVINSTLIAGNTYGTASSYQITATNIPTGYNATSLPTGMSVNISSGLITVNATTGAGVYNITISATNASGTGNAILVYTVSKATVIVTADDKSKTYGAANPTFTASYNNFVNGENLGTSGITGAPQLTTTATTFSPLGTYPITASLGTLSASNYQFSFADGTLTITCSGGYVWTGAANDNNFNNVVNWNCGIVPSNGADISINSGKTLTLSNDVSLNNIGFGTGSIINLNNTELTITGNVSGTTPTFIGSSASDIVIASGTPFTLNFTGAGGHVLHDLVINRNISLGNVLAITAGADPGSITVGSGATFTTNDFLTLKSDTNGTARVGISPGIIDGKVEVERYIPQNSNRGWRMLAIPTQGAQSIHASWQENAATYEADPAPGYGTRITANTTTAVADGYDAQTYGNSLLRYNPGGSPTWPGVTNNTTTTPVATTSGWMLYIRGDRTVDTAAFITGSKATTLRTKGPLYQGTQTAINLAAGASALVGNIYASEIDFTGIIKNGGIDNTYYVWDPLIYGSYGLGAFVTFSAPDWLPNPSGGSYTNAPNTKIKSGMAFIVHATGSGSLQLTEACKSDSVGNSISLGFRPQSTTAYFKTNLYAINGTMANLADGNTVAYNNIYSNGVDGNDAIKVTNFGEGIGLVRENKILAIERRKEITDKDSIFFRLTGLKTMNYKLEFTPITMNSNGMLAFLEDNYLSTTKPIDLNTTSSIVFSVNAANKATFTDRFRVVFKAANTVPVSFIKLEVSQQSRGMNIAWAVTAENGISSYNIERSSDGINFRSVGNVTAKGISNETINYTWLDASSSPGVNYYRIKSLNISGESIYTSIVKVINGKDVPSITIACNLVQNGRYDLQFNDKDRGTYLIKLINANGQLIQKKQIVYNGGNSTEVIALPATLVNGLYHLEVRSPNGTKEVIKLLVE